MSIVTPNLGLLQPTINVDSGLTWEDAMNSNSSILDLHNHSPGSGTPINPAGLNINTDLTFNNNSATNLKSLVFTAQPSIALNQSLYVSGADLYFNDGNANVVRLTSGGTVNATSSGISSGTATASFVGAVLVVNSASNTPANIQGGSLLIGNNSAGSKYLTLGPPLAMAANYSLTLPSIPAAQNFMTLDTSGNMSAPWAVDSSTIEVSSNVVQVKAGGIGTTQLADGSVTTNKLAPLGQQLSSTINFTTASLTAVTVTNATVTITSTGRPAYLGFISSGAGSVSGFEVSASGNTTSISAQIAIFRNATIITTQLIGFTAAVSVTQSFFYAPGMITFIDTGASAGTNVYTVKAFVSSGVDAVTFGNLLMIGWEL